MSAPHIAVERLGADYFQDPYSVHARLRARRPVTPVIMPGGATVWLVTGYAEARAALADPRMSKRMPGWHPEPGSVIATMDLHMLNSDPPDHGRLRRLVNKAFTVRQVERLRPRITAITAGLLDDMADQGAKGAKGPARGGSARVVRVPAADHRDLRAARRAARRPGRLPHLVGHYRVGHPRTRGVPGARHRDGPLLHGAAGGQAAAARRRPAVGVARGPGRRGQAQRERAGVDGVPAAGGRARDHGQPDRQRHARAAAQPGRTRPAARRPGADRQRGGGAAAVREPGQQRDLPVRRPSRSSSAACASAGAIPCSSR